MLYSVICNVFETSEAWPLMLYLMILANVGVLMFTVCFCLCRLSFFSNFCASMRCIILLTLFSSGNDCFDHVFRV